MEKHMQEMTQDLFFEDEPLPILDDSAFERCRRIFTANYMPDYTERADSIRAEDSDGMGVA